MNSLQYLIDNLPYINICEKFYQYEDAVYLIEKFNYEGYFKKTDHLERINGYLNPDLF